MKKPKLIKIVTFIVVVIFLLVVLLYSESRTEYGGICSICASSKSKTVWRLDVTTSVKYEQSPLEKWMIENNIEHEHDWRAHATGKNWLGMDVSYGCGLAPPIIIMPIDLLMEYIHSASDEDVKSLVEILKSGDEDAQEAKFQEIADLLLD